MMRGLSAALIVGIVCAVLGAYIVLRGMAFFGDAIAHAILPGVAVGYLLGGSGQAWLLLGGGLVAGIVSALGIGAISRSGIKEDTAIGVIFAGMFALGIALISTVRSYTVDLTHFL
ncbi:MAG TPA: metal ABC transporter permease, partial [Anaerolineae bacterium]